MATRPVLRTELGRALRAALDQVAREGTALVGWTSPLGHFPHLPARVEVWEPRGIPVLCSLYSPYEAKFGSDAVGFEVDGFRDIFETGDRKVFHVTGKFDLSVPEGPDVEVNLATPRPHEARHFRDNWNLVPPEDKATDWDFSLELARCQTRLELERAEASPGTWKTD